MIEINLKSYAEELRDELDDFAEQLRHAIAYCETESSYVFRVEFVKDSSTQIEVELNEVKVFADAPDSVKQLAQRTGKQRGAKTVYESDCFWVIRSKNFGRVEELIAWHDAGLVINQILTRGRE